jgi:hypothetical protein
VSVLSSCAREARERAQDFGQQPHRHSGGIHGGADARVDHRRAMVRGKARRRHRCGARAHQALRDLDARGQARHVAAQVRNEARVALDAKDRKRLLAAQHGGGVADIGAHVDRDRIRILGEQQRHELAENPVVKPVALMVLVERVILGQGQLERPDLWRLSPRRYLPDMLMRSRVVSSSTNSCT